jgi:hypothetical protein
MFLLPQLLLCCALGYAGGRLVARRGYPPIIGIMAGALSGGAPLILAPVTFAILALLPRTAEARRLAQLDRETDFEASSDSRRQNCPKCGREVSANAYVCPVCEFHFPRVSSIAAEIPRDAAAGPKEN